MRGVTTSNLGSISMLLTLSGMVKGVAKGMFKEVLREMKASGYRVACRMLDAQWLGIPQRRRRVIFVGVRDDLGLEPAFRGRVAS